MSATRIAGGNCFIASCDHAVRAGECYAENEVTGELYCWECYDHALSAQVQSTLDCVQGALRWNGR